MNVRVLIVDDSFFFRRRLSEAIDGKKGIEVVGFASNGKEAIELVQNLHPDVVTLDIEMPHINGLEALKAIMKKAPVPVLMFSALTTVGADITMKALEFGALDFLPKNFNELAARREDVIEIVTNKILALSRARNIVKIRTGDSESPVRENRSPEMSSSDISRGKVQRGQTPANEYSSLSKQISRNTSDLFMKTEKPAGKSSSEKKVGVMPGIDVEQAVNKKDNKATAADDMKWKDVSFTSFARDLQRKTELRKNSSDFHNFQNSFNEDGKTRQQAHAGKFSQKMIPGKAEILKSSDEKLRDGVLKSDVGIMSRDEVSTLMCVKRNQPFVDKSLDIEENGRLETAVKNRKKAYSLLVFGASTGGPAAMFSMIEHFPADFPIPIIIVQHMPENFTKAFADRLNRSGKIKVSEAYDGQELQPGCAYVAPGGMQTLVTRVNGKYVIRIRKSPAELYYRPCIDITLGSLSKIYNDRVLGIIMTGMGADGTRGAGILRSTGSSVWVQGESSCVIYGMPKSVIQAGYADRVVELEDMPRSIIEEVCGR